MNIFRILERHLAINHDMYSFNSPLRTSILALVGVSVLWKDSDKFVSFLLGILLTDFVDPGGSLGMKLKFTGLSGITTVLGATLAATALPLFPSRPIEYSRVCSSQICMLSETIWNGNIFVSFFLQEWAKSEKVDFTAFIFYSDFFFNKINVSSNYFAVLSYRVLLVAEMLVVVQCTIFQTTIVL